MRVLVTGASGFSGSYIAAELARSGFDVTGTYRRGLGFAEPLQGSKGLTLVHADLGGALSSLGAFETVVHTAATSPAPGVTNSDLLRDNSEATVRLAEAAVGNGCNRFIYLSSLSIYGEITVPVVDENTPIANPDRYGVTKFQGEQAIAAHETDFSGIALRLPGVIGHGAHRNWLSGVAAKLRAAETITAFELGAPFNNACHVADLAHLIAGLCDRDWQGFDAVVLGARGSVTVRNAIERLASAISVTAHIDEIEAPKPGFILSSDRAISRWGYDPMEIGTMIERYGREI